MSLRWVDSFSHYATADLGAKYTTTGSGPTISAGTGRFGGSLQGTNPGAFVTKTLDSQPTWIVGFAFKTGSLSAGTLLTFLDGATVHVTLVLTAAGTLSLTRNGTAVTGGTSTLAIQANTWYYIETKVTIADSIAADSAKVRVNGADWITVTAGQDLRNAGNASANIIKITSGSSLGSQPVDFADLYICDGIDATGLVPAQPYANNDFLGDCRVDALIPSGNGSNTANWTYAGAGVATLAEAVDEAAADGDTSYITSATPGAIATFALPNLATTPTTIYGVQVVNDSRKDDAGTRTIANEIRSNGNNYAGTSVNIGNSYVMYPEIWQGDPGNAYAAWTPTTVNALEAGVQEVA